MDNIHIRELLLKKHYMQNLTPAEEVELETLLLNSEEARRIEREIKAIPQEDAKLFVSNMDLDTMFTNIIAQNNSRKKGITRLWIPAAAILLIISIVAGWLVIKPNTNTGKGFVSIENPGKEATLQLANGKMIYLSDSGNQHIGIDNNVIKNNNRVIQLLASSEIPASGKLSWNTISVPNRLDYEIHLPDGSVAWLNSATIFRFPLHFGKTIREVYLDAGEAYFKVATNSTQPFMVHTQQADITVLGTEFNINAYSKERVLTFLVSGKVQLTSADHTNKVLQPGEQGQSKGSEIQVSVCDLSSIISWRQGIHYFHDTPVSEVGEMLNRWFNRKLIIDDPKTAAIHIRGKLFRQQPIQYFIDQINEAGTVTFYWKDGELHVK